MLINKPKVCDAYSVSTEPDGIILTLGIEDEETCDFRKVIAAIHLDKEHARHLADVITKYIAI